MAPGSSQLLLIVIYGYRRREASINSHSNRLPKECYP